MAMKYPLFDTRTLLAPYKWFDHLSKAFPKRIVVSDMHIAHDEFYYFSYDKHVRRVKIKDRSIWVCDYDRGPPWMKRVR